MLLIVDYLHNTHCPLHRRGEGGFGTNGLQFKKILRIPWFPLNVYTHPPNQPSFHFPER